MRIFWLSVSSLSSSNFSICARDLSIEPHGPSVPFLSQIRSIYQVGNLDYPVGITFTSNDATFANSFDDDGEYWGVVSSGDDVPYVPSSSLAIVLGFVSDSGLTGNLRLVSNGSACSTAACGTYQNIDSHNFVDTNLRKSVNENLDVYMIVENLLDSADVVARAPKDGARAQKPRTMKIGFSYKF